MRLQEQVAIVTGAGQGIGRAIAQRFAREGARVVLAELEATGEEAAEAVREEGGEACFVRADVANEEDRKRVVREAVRQYGGVDILVNNAAIFFPRSVAEMSVEEWRRLLAVNLDAVFFLSQAVLPIMRDRGGGRIVNIASINGWLGAADSAHYNAAKGGVLQVTRCLAVEVAPDEILVNAIAPGFVHTPMSVIDGVDETETDWFREFYIGRRRIPLARPGQPDEIASAALFLASEDCRYITGQVLTIDGGLSITF